jgi:uncharacterized membrane protein YfcA
MNIQTDIWAPEILLLLIFVGFLVGVVNTFAGSGTAIGYAVCLILGLTPAESNGTVRLGVVFQTFAASLKFYKKKYLDLKNGLLIAVPITLGSLFGAEIAVNINQEIFRKIIGFTMILMMFFMFYKPYRWIREHDDKFVPQTKIWHHILYFFIGIYGGFIHIGVGIFILSALVLVSGYNLAFANSLKTFIVLIYTPFTLALFIFYGDIHYGIGFLMAIGNAIGGWFAANYIIKLNINSLKWILAIILLVFSIYLFGMLDFIKT